MTKLRDYVIGNCEQVNENTTDGSTVDMVFFRVKMGLDADKDVFEKLAREEYPNWFDGEEHNYLQTGGDVGDQGQAMMIMGLGYLLGVWELLSPAMLPIPKELQLQMAGVGMISIISADVTD